MEKKTFNDLIGLVEKSTRKSEVDQVWLKRELHAILQSGPEVSSYFLDNIGKKHKNNINSIVGYVLGCTDEKPTCAPNLILLDLPDIDIDFPDTKRHMVFEYLQNKYGFSHVSKMGNLNLLQPASVLEVVRKRFAIQMSDISGVKNALIDHAAGDARYGHSLEDTLAETSPGQRFADRHEIAAKCLSDLELHPSHTGVHAAAILVCNEKISDFCTVNADGIAQIDKRDAETLNLLKIDALGLRTLGIIEDSGVVSNDQLYGMSLDDPKAFEIINSGKVSDIFQFSGQALQRASNQISVTSFQQIDHITAIARPGPLGAGMLDLYADKAAGRLPISFVIPQLEDHLGETYGLTLYQEQIMQICRVLGGFDWPTTNAVRKAMAKSAGAEVFAKFAAEFIKGAKDRFGIDQETSGKIWDDLCAFGAYAFNKSHSVSYAVISYWCCWIKAHHPLEWAAANLRAAKDEAQTLEILREMSREGVTYTAFDPELSVENWAVRDGHLVGGVRNVKGVGPVKALAFLQDRAEGKVDDKYIAKLLSKGVQFSDLQEAHSLFGHFYENPSLIGVRGERIVQMAEIGDRDEAVFIAKLSKKSLESENDAKRLKKRNGKLYNGNPEFLDMKMADDSISIPITCRIRPEKYEEFGREIFELAPKGSWFLVRGWKISGFDMFIVKKIKRLS